MPTKQEMLDRINEVIADKSHTFGCRIYNELFWNKSEDIYTLIWIVNKRNRDDLDGCWLAGKFEENRISFVPLLREHYENSTTIWHPVMIGDVLDRQYKTKEVSSCPSLRSDIVENWLERRKPIDNQPDKCIKFVYSLLPTK